MNAVVSMNGSSLQGKKLFVKIVDAGWKKTRIKTGQGRLKEVSLGQFLPPLKISYQLKEGGVYLPAVCKMSKCRDNKSYVDVVRRKCAEKW